MAQPPPAFTLRIRVVAGAQLVCATPVPVPWVQVAPGRGGFWSPYPQQTKHSQGGNPVWNETFDIPIADPAQDQIKISLFDHAAQAQVGEGIIPLTNLRGPSTENEMWVPIASAQGPRGQIQVYLNPLNFGVGGGAVMGGPPPGGMMMSGPPQGGVMMTPPPQQQVVVQGGHPGMGGPPPQQMMGGPPPQQVMMGGPPPQQMMGGPPQQHVVMTGAPPPHMHGQQTVVMGGAPGYGGHPGGHTVVVGGHGKFKKGKFKHKKFKHKKFKYKAPKIKLGKFKPKFKW